MSAASNKESRVQRRKLKVKIGRLPGLMDTRLAQANRIMVYIAAVGLVRNDGHYRD